ncbi:hypothetical protein R3W88_008304 [Solanum pinnatisectum]|uniref:Uncharacterized protein n=1 Tax=Solanum pinnatisectum TaxID=50273 RepID=A0AAV9M8J5_9SOLN|nr:hypothetical protein R3W88_008304 [Solanum pinnatisectum]
MEEYDWVRFSASKSDMELEEETGEATCFFLDFDVDCLEQWILDAGLGEALGKEDFLALVEGLDLEGFEVMCLPRLSLLLTRSSSERIMVGVWNEWQAEERIFFSSCQGRYLFSLNLTTFLSSLRDPDSGKGRDICG